MNKNKKVIHDIVNNFKFELNRIFQTIAQIVCFRHRIIRRLNANKSNSKKKYNFQFEHFIAQHTHTQISYYE